jgi:heptosyltransferase III
VESAVFSCLFGNNHVDFNGELIKLLKSYDDVILFSFSRDPAENIKKASGTRVFQIHPRPEPFENIHVGRYLISMMVNAKLLKAKAENNFVDICRDFRNPDLKKKKVFIHPGSGSRIKNWPIRYFLELGKLLSDDGFEPVFIIGPAEDGLAEFILSNGLSDKQILQLFDSPELVNDLKTGGAFIGNDSGVSHLAAFMGLPTLVIFGPTQPLRWRPMGRKVETITCQFECKPCFETSKKGCESMDCLVGISPEQLRNKFNIFMRSSVPD